MGIMNITDTVLFKPGTWNMELSSLLPPHNNYAGVWGTMFTNPGRWSQGKSLYETRFSGPSSLLFPITAITDCQSLISYYQPPADFCCGEEEKKKKIILKYYSWYFILGKEESNIHQSLNPFVYCATRLYVMLFFFLKYICQWYEMITM